MGFTDWAFPDGKLFASYDSWGLIRASSDAPLFPTAKWMLSFLESYAEHFNLLPKIKFNTVVTAVNLAPASAPQAEGARFVIKYSHVDGDSGSDSTIIVDRLIVATGVASQHNIPTIDGVEHFRGDILHSGNFRTSVMVLQHL